MTDLSSDLPPVGGRRAAIQAELAQLAAQAAADADNGPSYRSAGLQAPSWQPPAPEPAASAQPPVPAASPVAPASEFTFAPPAPPVAPPTVAPPAPARAAEPSWDELIAAADAAEAPGLTAPPAPTFAAPLAPPAEAPKPSWSPDLPVADLLEPAPWELPDAPIANLLARAGLQAPAAPAASAEVDDSSGPLAPVLPFIPPTVAIQPPPAPSAPLISAPAPAAELLSPAFPAFPAPDFPAPEVSAELAAPALAAPDFPPPSLSAPAFEAPAPEASPSVVEPESSFADLLFPPPAAPAAAAEPAPEPLVAPSFAFEPPAAPELPVEPPVATPAWAPPAFEAPAFEAPALPAWAPPPFEQEEPAASVEPVVIVPPSPAPAFEAPAFEPPAFTAPAADITAPATRAFETRAPEPAAPNRADADPELLAALQEVLLSRASDLHVTANSAPMLRVDGGLRAAPGTEVWNKDKVRSALYSLLTAEQRAAFELEHELDFAYTVSANARFRVNYYQQRDAIGAAFRLIPTEIRDLKALGVPDTVARFASLARGMVLVTGPTGSGKSTTLAALIDLVNSTRADHIVTIEDPIEFLHNHKRSIVNQREVGHDTHSFGNALKHVLRQDPDVILVGELRDLETISVALTAAETGHLVFATLHTQDAAQTIDRIIDVFPPHQQDQVRTQLAATLQGVVCQSLVRKADGTGRAVATEVLVTTPAVANLIREGKTYQIASAMQAGRDLGMHTMDQHLADLVNTGRITREDALEIAHDPSGFDRLVHRVETPADAVSRAFQAEGPDFGDSFSRIAR